MNDETERYLPYDSIQYLNKRKHVEIWGGKLPHWFQENKTVFATFRLSDSLPQDKLEVLHEERLKMQQDAAVIGADTARENYNWRIMQKMEKWLNNGYGNCCLADSSIREIVSDSLFFYDGKQYVLHSFVIMPNHVHILLTPLGTIPVLNSLGKVKSYTANIINNKLEKKGQVWQHGIFDRLIRSADDFTAKWNYILQNPINLPQDSYTLYLRNN